MADIVISDTNFRSFENDIKNAIKGKMSSAFRSPEMEKMLFNISKTLTNKIASSPEWVSLKTDLVGEFGFTPEELPHIDEILKFIESGVGITDIRIKISADKMTAFLEWVNFDKLEKHPLAYHPLTKRESINGPFIVTGTASWIDWLEHGKTVTGYEFSDINSPFSRSGKGIMRKEDGGIWTFRPTDLFFRTGKEFDKTILKSGFMAVFQKKARG